MKTFQPKVYAFKVVNVLRKVNARQAKRDHGKNGGSSPMSIPCNITLFAFGEDFSLTNPDA
jgi:hypothetical protein